MEQSNTEVHAVAHLRQQVCYMLTAAWLPLFVVLLQVTNALHLSLLHLDDQLALFNDYTREN